MLHVKYMNKTKHWAIITAAAHILYFVIVFREGYYLL